MSRQSTNHDRFSGSHRSHRPPGDMRTTHYDPTDIGTTVQDAVSMPLNTLSESSHPCTHDCRHQDQPYEPLHSIARVREVLPHLKGRFKTRRALPRSKDDPEDLYPQPPSNLSLPLSALSALLIALTLSVDSLQLSCSTDDTSTALDAQPLPGHGGSTASTTRSRQPSSSITSIDAPSTLPNHSCERLDCSLNRPDRSFDHQDRLSSAMQAPACSLQPEDRLRDPVTLAKTPQGLSSTPEEPDETSIQSSPTSIDIDSHTTPQQSWSTPERPDKVSIEPSSTPVNIDSYTTPIPSGKSSSTSLTPCIPSVSTVYTPSTSFASCVQSVSSVPPVHTPSASHITRRLVHNISDVILSCTDVPRASRTVSTELTCSKAPSTSYLHSRDAMREVSTRSKADDELRHSETSSSSYTNDSDCLRNHTMRSQSLVSKDTKSRSTSKASTTTTSDPEHFKASLSSDLSAHNDLRAPYMRTETLVRASCASVTTLKTPSTPKGRSKYDCKDDTMQSHLRLHGDYSRASSFQWDSPPSVYNEAQAMLLNPHNYSLLDSNEILAYLPCAPNTTMYALSSESAEQYEFMPTSAGLTSAVRQDKEANFYRKTYRRLGRDLYNISMPKPEETRYPSQSCEEWASHIFKLLDTVVTFRPTCYISNESNELVPAQEIDYWPEYGELYLAYSQLINRSLTWKGEYNMLLPIPGWPASDHLFHAKAFEVAAVSFRDQMEQSIQKLYDIITIKSTDQTPSPVLSSQAYEDPKQEDLRYRVTQLDSDSSQGASHTHTTALPLLESTPQGSSRHSSRHSASHALHRSIKSQQTLSTPQELTTAAKSDGNVQPIELSTLITGSRATRPCPKPPDYLEKLLEGLRRLEQPMAQLTGATPAPAPNELNKALPLLKHPSKESSNMVFFNSIDGCSAAAPAAISTKPNVKGMTRAILVTDKTESLATRTSVQRQSLGQASKITQNTPGNLSDTLEAFDSSVSTSNDATNRRFLADTIAPTAHTCTSTRPKRPTIQCATTAPISSVNPTSLGTHAQGSTQYVVKLPTSRFIRSEDPPSRESLDNRPRTPSEPQDNSSLVDSSWYKALTPPIEPLPQESSRNPTHRTIESQYTPPPLAVTAPEAVDNNINYSSSLTRTISSQTPDSTPIGLPESTTNSQVPVVELTLLDDSDWFTDVMSHLDRLVKTDTRVHTPVERQANRIISSLATDNRSQQQDKPLGGLDFQQLPKPVAELVAVPVPTLPPKPVAQKRLCDTLPNTPKRRHVTPASTLTTSGTMEDHKLIDKPRDISIHPTQPASIDRPAKVNNRPEQLVISCASANHTHSSTIMIPPTTVNRSAPPVSNILSKDITKRPRKPSVTRSQDSLVLLLSTERPKALVQAPSKLPDELRRSRHNHSPSQDLRPLAPDKYLRDEEQESVCAPSRFIDNLALARHAAPVLVPEHNVRTAESINRNLPTTISSETQDSPHPDALSSPVDVFAPTASPTTRITCAWTTKSYGKALYCDIPDEEQVSNRLQRSPSLVGPEEQDSTHVCVPPSSTDPLGSTSSAATHATHARVVESALKALRIGNLPALSLRTSPTSSRSLHIDPPLQIDILTEPSFEVLAQFTASSITASDCSIKASKQSIERSNNVLFDCPLLDEVPTEPAPDLLAQRDNSLIASSNCRIQDSTDLVNRNNDTIVDPSLRKELFTESTFGLVSQSSDELFVVNEGIPTSEGRIEPNNDNIIDFSPKHEVLANPTPDRLTLLVFEPNIVTNSRLSIVDELIEHKINAIIDRTNTSSTVAAEEPESPHIFAPPDPVNPTDIEQLVASAATQTTLLTIAESTPGKTAEHQRDRTTTVPDLPSRADHPDRQTSFDAPRDAGVPGTAGPIAPSVKLSSVGSEEEQSRHTIPSVEPTRPSPSKYRHRRKALPFRGPNTSQQARSLAPPRPHTAARPVTPARHVAPVRPVNIHESPTYARSRLANSRQLNELFEDDMPGEQWNDRLEPTQVECEGGTKLSSDNSDKKQQVSQDRRSDPPGKPPDKPGDRFNNDSNPESHRSDPEESKDRSDDAYTCDIESGIDANDLAIDQKSSKQRLARKPRHFARSACAYTPINSDVTALYSEGDIFDINSISTRTSARSPAKRVNLYIHNVPNAQIGDSKTRMPEILRPLGLKQQITANFDSDGTFLNELTSDASVIPSRTNSKLEIDLIQACKPPLKEPEPPPLVQQFMLLWDQRCPVAPVNFPTSKFRDVVTGGDTWDKADSKKKLEELLTYLGGLKFSKLTMLTEHNALPWMRIFDIFLCKITTRHSTFPIDPGIRTLKKVDSNAVIVRTLWECLVHLLRTDSALGTVHNQPASMTRTLENRAKDDIGITLIKLRHSSDLNKILSEYSCSDHTSRHTCTNQDLTTRSCELQHRMSIDSTAQSFQRTQQASFDDLAKLVTASIEFALQSPANAAIGNRKEVPRNAIRSNCIDTHACVNRARELPPCELPLLLTVGLHVQTPQRTYRLEQEPIEAPTIRAPNDCGMQLTDSIHPGYVPVHECIDRPRTVPLCALKLLVKLDPSAQTLRRLNRLMQGAQRKLTYASQEFTLSVLHISQVLDNLRVQQVLIEIKAESDELNTHSVEKSSRNSLAGRRIRLGSSYITYPVANTSYSRSFKDPPSEPIVALAKHTSRQVSEHQIHGKYENSTDKRPIKRRKRRIKSTHTHFDPDKHAPNILVHLQLRDKDSKDNPY